MTQWNLTAQNAFYSQISSKRIVKCTEAKTLKGTHGIVFYVSLSQGR